MADLHDALQLLGPVAWADVPRDGRLAQYLRACFAAGELICNSVPPPPPLLPDASPSNASRPSHGTPNRAQSHADILPSPARPPAPPQHHEALQKHWGKPMKLAQKLNPLKISLFKMAAHDRHGAWFARTCVTEGLGFAKFKAAMMREFAASLAVPGGPGAGAVRGLAADRRLERIEVPAVGKLQVFELSAQFPGPVTPRDFVAMLLSGDDTLSPTAAADLHGSKRHVPRHFTVISRPVEHPDAPHRAGFVRGHYESVEMIREIPLTPAESKSASESTHASPRRNSTSQADTSSSTGDPELNPVEWIMITRSDPGGGIPRFLVERGTPEAMLEDVHKFFDWACAHDHIPHPDEDGEKQEASASGNPPAASVNQTRPSGPNRAAPMPANTSQQPPPGSTFADITRAIGAGLDAYAPTALSNVVHSQFAPAQQDLSDDDSSDTSSVDSFLSAEEMCRLATAPETPQPADSVDALSVSSGRHSEITGRPLSHHEKEVQKLTRKREKLDQQLAKKRMAEEQRIRQAHEKGQTEAEKSMEKLERDMRKTEERHRREVEKLEAKKEKEARKAEEKRRKKDEQGKLSLVSRERDEFRSQSDLLRRENRLLREQVAELQAQNTKLSIELGKLGGQEAFKQVSGEYGHTRTGSMKSMRSASSGSVRKIAERKESS